MYRPFVGIGIGALLASFAALDNIWLSAAILILTFGFTVLVITKKHNQLNKGVFIALIFILLCVRVVSLGLFVENKNKELVGLNADVTAEVTEISYSSNNFSAVTLKIIDSSEEKAKGIKLRAIFNCYTDALPGDIIKANLTFTEKEENYRARDFGNGYYFSGEVEEIYSYTTNKQSLARLIYNVRTAILNAIDESVHDRAGAVLKALVIGDDSCISDELNQSVKLAGVSHMLVVSGMHLGIICGVIMNIINRRTKPVLSAVIVGFAAVFILAVCLFHVSILRASIAYIVMLIGRVFKRDTDPLSALGFGIAVAVFLMPYIFHNVAFLLSITATFAVLYPARMLIKAVSFESFGIWGRALRYAFDILIIAVCTLVCTLPITVYFFGYVVLAAPLSNLAVTFAMNAALVFGVAAVILFFLPFGRFISFPLFFLASAFINYFIFMVEFIGKNNFGVIYVDSNKNIYCFLIVGAFILLVKKFSKYIILKREEKPSA